MGAPWAPFWEGLGAFWMRLGRSWPPLGRSWALLGISRAPLRRPLGGLGRLLGASWAAWVPLGRILNDLGSILKAFKKGLGGVWMGSGRQNNCFLMLNKSFSLNPKCGTQGSKFPSLCLSNYHDAIGPSMLAAHPILLASELPGFQPPDGLGGMREA